MSLQVLQASLKVAMSRGALLRTSVLKQHMATSAAAASAAAPDDDVIITKVDDKAIFTLNRPKVLNALNVSMIRKMTESLKRWKAEHSTKFVIIKGAGGKAFCCGGDLREVTESGRKFNFFFEEYTLDYMTSSLGFPWIALIDGITMGAGCGLSVHGTYRIATERTLFAMPETAIGLFPDVGGGYFLPRLPGQLGMYLALTGVRVKGRDVQKIGVATHFVESSQLANLENDLMSLRSPTLSEIDNVIKSYHDKSSLDHDKPYALEPHMDKINSLFSGESLEEIFSKLHSDGSEWSKAQLTTLNKMSPTSMKVSFRQLKEGARLTLAQDLKMEHRLAQRFIRDKDFFEGVRALIVDKDQNPKWNPARIEDVTDEKLDWYFSPLTGDLQELEL